MNYCIQRPFVKKVTALIKIRHFFRRRLFGKKKSEAETGDLYVLRSDVFQKEFRCLQGKKSDAGATALNEEKRKPTVLPSWQTDRTWLLVKLK